MIENEKGVVGVRKRWWIAIGVGVLVAGTAGFAMTKSGQPAGVPVKTAKVMQADLENQVLTTGKVKAKEETVVFSEGTGILRQFNLTEGDAVKKGQVIGNIDVSDTESKIAQLEAQIAEERAKLEKTKAGSEPEEIAQAEEQVRQRQYRFELALKEYQRTEQLYKSGAASKQELDNKQQDLRIAESELTAGKQNLALKQKGPRKEELLAIEASIQRLAVEKEQAEKERNQSAILAPADGTVISLKAKNGQHLNKGAEILTIADLSQLEIVSEVSESDVKKIKPGQQAVIEGPALGKEKLKAEVVRIAPVAVTGKDGKEDKTSVDVTLALMERSEVLKPGFQVDVRIVSQKASDVLQVAYEAVQQEGDGTPYVWVAEEGKAKKRKVQTGIESELSVELKSGVRKDEKVILNPPPSLKENDAVVESDNLPPLKK